jgi:hypothetical protein
MESLSLSQSIKIALMLSLFAASLRSVRNWTTSSMIGVMAVSWSTLPLLPELP